MGMEPAPLEILAELVKRKGYEGVHLGQTRERFGISQRNHKCVAFNMPREDEDKRWIHSFYTCVEQGTGVTRIILSGHDTRNGYTFLLRSDDRPEKVLRSGI